MPASAATLVALQRLLDGCSWLGAEIDLTYRVLALTIEPPPAWASTVAVTTDPRLQVLLSPASTISACLRVLDDPPRIEAFEVGQLADVVAAMDAPVLSGQMVGRREPTSPVWPVVSLAGRSTAPDGHTHRLLVEAANGSRRMGLFATFDEVEVRTADGHPIDLA